MENMTITLRTGSGIPKQTVILVEWTDSKLRTTHNGDTRFHYRSGKDSNGVEYETKSRGGGWRVKS